ncbi:Isocitrate dehydrogenase [NAD] [hydrothermal vent metagenome]|uniref:Isocitrate dehydrogenase [NAD] n=1 Tax=hydrothermal vent metagenome TaxID=652676 RepID=A0A3B1DL21_9ZZZZ
MSKQITIIPGDGIGPSIVEATLKVLDKLGCGFEYECVDAGVTALEQGKELIPQETIDSIKRNGIALKGPVTTPVGEGFTSINVALRKMFHLYANVRPVVSFPGTQARYENIDILTIRENTEGMYSGLKQTVSEDGEYAEAMSVVTREGSERVVRFAYELARKKGRKKIAIVHKANIMKSTSGLFLKTAREISKNFTDIETVEYIVDNCCMQLVMNPQQFDMIVTTNLFGDIVSDLCAGLVGGLGMAPGANIGQDTAIFEAVHGSAPDIAGKNFANPTSLMLASALMLDYCDMKDKANTLRKALGDVIASKDRCTGDLGGKSGTTDFTQAVLERV